MKKTIRKIYLCFIITILFTTGIALGNDTNLENKEYTEIYKQWLELSDEQKENLIHRLTEVSSEIMNVPQEFFSITIKELPDKNFGIGGKTIDKVKSEYMKKQK